MRPKSITSEQRQQALMLVSLGYRKVDIAEMLGVKPRAIFKNTPLVQPHLTEDIINAMIEDRRIGLTMQQIADRYGISKSTACVYLNRVKIQSRTVYGRLGPKQRFTPTM